MTAPGRRWGRVRNAVPGLAVGEAWFFGVQTDGTIDLTSKFRATLEASLEGGDVEGDLTMDGVTYTSTAAEVPAPAGMYIAALGGVRDSWVLRPNGSAGGVQFGGLGGDFGIGCVVPIAPTTTTGITTTGIT